ncbi:hypothetical protein ACFPM0_17680 [Pseudonocardia sulfidoxydans]|uniref:hypothetical protein n=1 Tax=Pseudonocardia sulfidoxydans TaxID=54011 RepID=UPI0036140923
MRHGTGGLRAHRAGAGPQPGSPHGRGTRDTAAPQRRQGWPGTHVGAAGPPPPVIVVECQVPSRMSP